MTVKGLFTPLLQKVYLAFAIFCAIYFAYPVAQRSSWNRERLYKKLLASDSRREKGELAASLGNLGGQEQLMRALKSDSDTTRETAAGALFDIWFKSAGEEALRLLEASGEALEQHEFVEATAILSRLVETFPFYAEGWNRRATLYWQMGDYERAVADCKKVVLLNPDQFAAWQGLGMGYMRLNEIPKAIRAFKAALRLVPHDRATQQYLNRCEQMLRQKPMKRGGAVEFV